MREALAERVPVRENGRVRHRSKAELLIIGNLNKAIKGDARTLAVLKSLFEEAGVLRDEAPNGDERLSPGEAELLEEMLSQLGLAGDRGAE